jgi:hypothetical protein
MSQAWAGGPAWIPGRGIAAVTVDSARQAIELIRRGHGHGPTLRAAGEVIVEADMPELPVGIDGETVIMPAPARCTIRPKVLTVLGRVCQRTAG